KRLAEQGERYDPRVATRIRRGAAFGAADVAALHAARRDWITCMERAVAPYDALLSPTVPMVAPPLAPLVESDEAFFAANARMLRNPSVVNLLDGCAISMPIHEPGDWPVGLMIWGPAMADDRVLELSLAVEATLAARR